MYGVHTEIGVIILNLVINVHLYIVCSAESAIIGLVKLCTTITTVNAILFML